MSSLWIVREQNVYLNSFSIYFVIVIIIVLLHHVTTVVGIFTDHSGERGMACASHLRWMKDFVC